MDIVLESKNESETVFYRERSNPLADEIEFNLRDIRLSFMEFPVSEPSRQDIDFSISN